MKENIPQVVIEEAKDLIDQFGENFKILGNYKGQDVFLFKFPENVYTGFPKLFLYDKAKDVAVEISGFEALNIISILKWPSYRV